MNERLLRDGCETVALLGGLAGAPSSQAVRLWLEFAERPTGRNWSELTTRASWAPTWSTRNSPTPRAHRSASSYSTRTSATFSRMLDYAVIVPRLQRLYEWSADELAEPRVLGLIRDGNPIYAWPFEERHVWRTSHMPFPARVLEHLTRPP